MSKTTLGVTPAEALVGKQVQKEKIRQLMETARKKRIAENRKRRCGKCD